MICFGIWRYFRNWTVKMFNMNHPVCKQIEPWNHIKSHSYQILNLIWIQDFGVNCQYAVVRIAVSPSAMALESSCLPLRNDDVENVSRKCQHEVMFQGVPNLSSITKVKGSSLEVMDTPSWSFPWRCTFTYISEGIIWRMVCTLWRVCWISFSTSFDFHVCGRFLAFGN